MPNELYVKYCLRGPVNCNRNPISKPTWFRDVQNSSESDTSTSNCKKPTDKQRFINPCRHQEALMKKEGIPQENQEKFFRKLQDCNSVKF